MTATNNALYKKITRAQIRALFDQSIFLFFIAIAMMLAVAYIFWESTNSVYLKYWLLISLTFTFIRVLFIKQFDKINPQGDSVLTWGAVFTALSFISGILWGSTALFLINSNEVENASIVAIILAGVSTGSLAPMSSYLPAQYSFSIPALAPIIFIMLSNQNDTFILFGYLLTAFLFVNLSHAFIINRNNAASFKLRFENIDLLSFLEKKKDEAEKANKDKSRFLTATSHDLRQPLHAMDLYLGALGNALTTDEQRSLLEKTQASSSSLSKLLNALMEVSQLDSGNVTTENKLFNIYSLLHNIHQSMLPESHKNNFSFKLDSESFQIFTDPLLLERIIRNLITNAIKHSHGSNITLCATSDNGIATISVYDDGYGIENAEIENIFSEFYQLNNSERDRTKGLGLGLAIVQRISKQLNLELNVSSTLNEGSTFSVKLPVYSHENTLEQNKLDKDKIDLSGLFIIAIEDEISVMEAMRLLLRSWDCEVLIGDSIESITEALNQTKYSTPDLIISDYRLRKNKTGLQAINTLRKIFKQTVPAIIVTGDTDKDIAVKTKNEGCELIYKPIDVEILKNAIYTATS